MPGPRPKSAGSKGGKKKKGAGKNRLPPRPDLRNYGARQGVQAKPGWYTAPCLDEQLDACVKKLIQTSPLNQRNGLPRGLLLGALASPRLGVRSGPPQSCLGGQDRTLLGFHESTLGGGNGSRSASQSHTGPLHSARTLGRLESKTRAGNAVKAAVTSDAMMVLSGTGPSRPPPTQAPPNPEKTSLAPCVSITQKDVKASNLTNDPRFLEMSEALATYEDAMREAAESPALGCTTVQVPPSSVTKIEGQWIPKDCSKEGQTGVRRGYLPPMEGLEPLVWARPPTRYCPSQAHHHLEGSADTPADFLDPSSYELCPGVALPADSRHKRSAFFQELECRLREMLTSGDPFFRLSQLDAVYDWYSREQAMVVGGSEENDPHTEAGKTNLPSHPADYPPTHPPPSLPSSSGAFDATALATCHGSAFYDPNLVLMTDSFDSLGTSETIDASSSRKERVSSLAFRSPSSSTSSGWNSSASSSGISTSHLIDTNEHAVRTKIRQPFLTHLGRQNQVVRENSLSGERPPGSWESQQPRKSSSHGVKSNFLASVQDHAPLITPSDRLSEMETRCLLPPQTDQVIMSRREQMLSKKCPPFSLGSVQENEKARWGVAALGDLSGKKGGKGASPAQPPSLSPSSNEKTVKTLTGKQEMEDAGQWARRCSERCKGNLQQRYLRDPRSIRPPWGMRNIYLVGPPLGITGPSVSSEGILQEKFEKAGAPPRCTFAGESRRLPSSSRQTDSWQMLRSCLR